MRWVAVLLGALIAFSLASGGPAPASQAHAGGLIAQIRIGCALPQPLADCTAYVDAVRLFDAAAGTFSDVASCSCSLESAQWSPDGRRLLIHAGAAFELYEAGAVRALPGLVNIAWAAWEPSRRSLLVSLRGGRLERIDLAGHVLASLGTVRGVEKLDVSPRGLIAYDRAPRPRRNRVVPSSIWVARRDGTHSRRLTEGQAPRWSPNGRWITYSRFGLRGAEVWVMRASGGRPRPLSRAATEIGPAWSPDGRRVAFVRCVHEKCQIRTVGSHGGPSTRVASAASPGFALDWQRTRSAHTDDRGPGRLRSGPTGAGR